MWAPRIIPCLLLFQGGLVKTVRFENEHYVGDPFNTIRIFNEKEVDELIFLDIEATVAGRGPRLDYLRDVASECFMPLCYGGGINEMRQIEAVLKIGVEKVAINAAACEHPDLIREAARAFGSQSVVVAMDVWKGFLGYTVRTHRGKRNQHVDPIDHARRMVDLGAGEIFLNSINRDGTGTGYDTVLIRQVTEAVGAPLIACGGAGSRAHFKEALRAGATAVAAGSLFVFYGKHRAVLITYPEPEEINEICEVIREATP